MDVIIKSVIVITKTEDSDTKPPLKKSCNPDLNILFAAKRSILFNDYFTTQL